MLHMMDNDSSSTEMYLLASLQWWESTRCTVHNWADAIETRPHQNKSTDLTA